MIHFKAVSADEDLLLILYTVETARKQTILLYILLHRDKILNNTGKDLCSDFDTKVKWLNS